MPKLCFPKPIADAFTEAIRSGKINIQKLLELPDTQARVDALKPYLGEAGARDAVKLIEQKLILKDKLRGLKNAIQKISNTGKYSPEKLAEMKKALADFKDMQKERILSPKEEQTFLGSLAEKLIGTEVSKEEAGNVFKLTQAVEELKKRYDEKTGTWSSPEAAKQYGAAKVVMEQYVEKLKTGDATLKEMLAERLSKTKEELKVNKARAIASLLMDTLKVVVDNATSMSATFDNSFIGRQGLNVLKTHPTIWWDMAKKSFVDIYKTLGNQDAHGALMAEMYARPNYLNGSYDIAKLIPKTEEQFPAALAERAPGVARVFKASENAFKDSAIRARADLFDLLQEKAKQNGVDITDEYQIKSIGKVVSSLTSRGQLGRVGESPAVKLVLWAPRMLKANWDVLTAHQGQDISPFARREAAINLAKIVGTTAAVMTIANAMKPGSAETDLRSSDFGKIKVGNTRFDYTGGASSLITLAARIAANSSKSTTTGQIVPYGTGFGQQTRFGTIIDFISSKANPPARVVIDWLKGRDFEGNKPTLSSVMQNLFLPISARNALKLKDDNSASAVAGVLLDALGINANTYIPSATNWDNSDSKELTQFKEKVGATKFKEANDLYNKNVSEWISKVKTNIKFQQLSEDDKQRLITQKKEDIKSDIFKKYKFKYKVEKLKKLPKL